MPALTATVSTTSEVALSPALRRKLVTKLGEYAKKKAEIAELQVKQDAIKAELGALRDETGEQSVTIKGHGTITCVAGYHKKFNPKKFQALGGDLAIYKLAVEEKPKKAFEKITLPGEKPEREDD